MKIIFIGFPFVGKTTSAYELGKKLNLPIISKDDFFIKYLNKYIKNNEWI